MRFHPFLLCFILISTFLISCEEESPLTSADLIPKPEEEEENEVEAIDWCVQNTCWDEDIFTCRDSAMIANFTRDEGWTGGDATYSIALPGDRVLWLFGDSFIDQVNEQRERPTLSLINNCLLLQDGKEFTTYHGGTPQSPEAYAVPDDGVSWYWPGHGRADEDTLYLFMHAFSTGGAGAWDFFRTGVDLLKIDPNTLEIFESNRLIDGGGISYGAHVMEEDDSVYIYGVLAEGTSKELYVARADLKFTQPWEYYSAGQWDTDPETATAMFSHVSEQFSVFKYNEKYYLLTQNHILGKEIYLYSSDSPVGPWENQKTIYCTPETGGDIITYNAYAHTMFTENGKLLVSYNINSLSFADLKDADNYRPYFITVENWE